MCGRSKTNPIESRVNGLAWLGDGYLAVGEDGFMMSSPEGSQWTQLSGKVFDLQGHWEINELATNGSTIVGVGAGIITGRHGIDWSWQPAPVDMGPTSVIWTGSAFWAAGENGVIRSLDGVHWAQVLVDHDLRLLTSSGTAQFLQRRVAVQIRERQYRARRVVVTSSDGHDWSYEYFDVEWKLFTVGWTGSRFVAAGSGSIYLTSTDGTDWQQHDWPKTSLWRTWRGTATAWWRSVSGESAGTSGPPETAFTGWSPPFRKTTYRPSAM